MQLEGHHLKPIQTGAKLEILISDINADHS